MKNTMAMLRGGVESTSLPERMPGLPGYTYMADFSSGDMGKSGKLISKESFSLLWYPR